MNKKNPIATIEMESGQVIRIELFPSIAPNTVANFVELANNDFYNGTVFHRIINGFMIQGGDPTGTGMGGPGYQIRGEFSSNGFENQMTHQIGVISMARTGAPNSAGSQFFIVSGDASHLDGSYAAFGKTIDDESLRVVLDIADSLTPRVSIANGKQIDNIIDKNGLPVRVNQNNLDTPVKPVIIKNLSVETFGIAFEAEKLSK